MSPKKGPLWEFYHAGDKQNRVHHRAYCLFCIKELRPSTEVIVLDEQGEEILNLDSAWFKDALSQINSVLGEKSAMAAHLVGSKPCPHTLSRAKKIAKQVKKGDTAGDDGDDELSDGEEPLRKKRKVVEKVKQTKLVFPKGIAIPFTDDEEKRIKTQFLRATISANLPFRWVDDPEVIKLFFIVEGELKKILKGQYVIISTDGVKDIKRDSVTGINVTVHGKSYLVCLKKTNKDKKDSESMSNSFEEMIDSVEENYGCMCVAFVTDDDGGSRKGRQLLVARRPWLFGPACAAHQSQLVLGDYFKENPAASETSEEATELLGWMLNHIKVRDIFDTVQTELSQKAPLKYLVANLTRWTTHFVAFDRLVILRESLRRAAFLQRADIIAAQFVVDDIEPICLAVNITQKESARPDQVVLAFGGLFLHFSNHSDAKVATAMKKRLEMRWAAFDQPLFIFSLILNPFEKLERFGDQANVSHYTLLAAFQQLYSRVKSRPELSSDNMAKAARVQEAAKAFFEYLSGTGLFADFEANKTLHVESLGDCPITFWKNFRNVSKTAELADFALLLLEVLVSSAGNERDFSDLKIKQTRLRNRLRLDKLEKMSKTGANIRQDNSTSGLTVARNKRKNHQPEHAAKLLSVSRYSDLLNGDIDDSEDSADISPVYIKSRAAWRREMRKWQEDEQNREGDDETDTQPEAGPSSRVKKWLPMSLEKLFGGTARKSVTEFMQSRQARRPFTEETLLMELLEAEYSDEPPDDGEMEGSGDDYA
ncbi:hypothetical protein D9757_015258 [Collybiopsis confluens]|uniref:DUF659 domain-containing protein n=1 Tax=Collybiopsis confluens TaxID=2823264 RepID=A0A8H5CXQ3_9AGAR|nr:hypothetical protein D9757_015258 [Collybiopsis confluens]